MEQTLRQAQTLGGWVRKGEKASQIMKYGTTVKQDENGEEEEVSFARSYPVFNADQIDGLPSTHYDRMDPVRDLGTQANPELEAFFAATGADIVTIDQPRAYYDLGMDRIHVPSINTFHNVAGYYGTLAHELTHWTGAEPRLDRFSRLRGDDDYAFEELIAEIGNCFLCAGLGLIPDFKQTAAYLTTWLRFLKEDMRVIYRAASDAQKAVDYIHRLQPSEGTTSTGFPDHPSAVVEPIARVPKPGTRPANI